jgi:Fe-S-cluster containining protein
VPLDAADLGRLAPLGLPILHPPRGATSPPRAPYLATTALAGGRRVCVALEGAPGARCACTIYADRPEACRRYEVGGALCRSARQWLGLTDPAPASLTPAAQA